MRGLVERFKSQFFLVDSLDLQEWRKLFSRMMIMVFALGFPVVLAVTFRIYAREHQYSLIALDVVFWFYLIFLAFAKVRSYRFSAFLFLILMYIIIITFLIKLGPTYTRPAWLVVCAVFAVFSLGLPVALGAVFLNAVILLLIYIGIGTWIPEWSGVYPSSFGIWVQFVINVTVVTLAAVVPIGYSLSKLEDSLRKVRKAHQDLSDKTEKLKKAYASLEMEVEERKKMEEALRKSEARYRLHFENVLDVIYFIDRDMKLRDVSPSAERVTGFKCKELLGKTFEESGIVAPEYVEKGVSHIRKILSGGQKDTQVIEFIGKDGRRIFGEVTSSPVYEDGKPIGVVGVARNITERKKAEDALRESEARYRVIVENSHDGILILDDQYRILFANQRLCDIVGCSCEEMLGTDFRDFLTGESRTLVAERYRKRQRGEEVPSQYEIEIETKTGEKRWFELRPTVVQDPEQGIRTIALIMDVTWRKKTEMERERLQAQLMQAQKMDAIGRLAGGVAHDFNNMLGVIIGHTELALMKLKRDDPLYGELEEIKKAADHSKEIVEQLLAFARKQTVSPKVIDLNEMVENMLKMLQRLIGEDIDLIWRPEPDLWRVRIDPMQIRQVLINLCVNARDAIDGIGKMVIETQNVMIDEAYGKRHPYVFSPGEYAMLAVSDNGCGMSREVLSKIFDPFFTTKGAEKGTGLGLSMVYGIVKQNAGFINVYSEPGQGTTFKIYLPRKSEETEVIHHEDQERDAVLEGKGEAILLVEDETVFLDLLKTILVKLGYRVLAAATPHEAIQIAENYQGEIQLMITDVIMPEMHGKDLAAIIQSLRPGLKLLFMSGYTANVIAHQGILEEGVNFIQKPFTMKDLSLKVGEILARPSREPFA